MCHSSSLLDSEVSILTKGILRRVYFQFIGKHIPVAFFFPFGGLTTSSISSKSDWAPGKVNQLPNDCEAGGDWGIMEMFNGPADDALLSSRAHCASAACAVAASAAALCDERRGCSTLVGSIILAVGNIDCFNRDQDDFAVV